MASGAETTLPSPQTEHPWPFATAMNAAMKTVLKIIAAFRLTCVCVL
jgi:hypothetical protein